VDIEAELSAMIEGALRKDWPVVEASAKRVREAQPPAATAAAAPDLSAGFDAIENGEYARAATMLADVTAKAPRDWQAWAALGYACLRSAKPAEASRVLRRSLHIWPCGGLAWACLGELLAAEGQRETASAHLRLAVYFSSQRPRTLEKLRETEGSLLHPKFRALIRSEGRALDELPARNP
jgi:Flp pilus assembly protein TadD